MSKPLISILGPTATGKTKLALSLAKQVSSLNFAGTYLISADSRQVYQGLETLTGADIPATFKKQQAPDLKYLYYSPAALRTQLHGVAIISPKQEWSATHFRNLAINLIKQAWTRNYLPIIVGGTGFYHQQIFNNDPHLYIKPQPKIRQQASKLNVKKLQAWLKTVATAKFAQMNHSDRHNPRRLTRAIEVALSLQKPDPATKQAIKQRPQLAQPPSYLTLALEPNFAKLPSKIKNRVEARLEQGALTEVKQLLTTNIAPSSPLLSATGLKPITRFLNQEISQKQLIKDWTLEEVQYSKRQMTWLKKQPNLHWFKPEQLKKTNQKSAALKFMLENL